MGSKVLQPLTLLGFDAIGDTTEVVVSRLPLGPTLARIPPTFDLLAALPGEVPVIAAWERFPLPHLNRYSHHHGLATVLVYDACADQVLLKTLAVSDWRDATRRLLDRLLPSMSLVAAVAGLPRPVHLRR